MNTCCKGTGAGRVLPQRQTDHDKLEKNKYLQDTCLFSKEVIETLPRLQARQGLCKDISAV